MKVHLSAPIRSIQYCVVVMLPQFLAEAQKLIDAHNADAEAHPAIQNLSAALDSRLSLLELMYNTDVSGRHKRLRRVVDDYHRAFADGNADREPARVDTVLGVGTHPLGIVPQGAVVQQYL